MQEGKYFGEDFVEHLSRFVGTTVTIFTTSGGASGCGFTGVVILCNPCFVRLITCVGPAPCCALGSDCCVDACPPMIGGHRPSIESRTGVRSVGSVADIPIDRIAAFVHHAI